MDNIASTAAVQKAARSDSGRRFHSACAAAAASSAASTSLSKALRRST